MTTQPTPKQLVAEPQDTPKGFDVYLWATRHRHGDASYTYAMSFSSLEDAQKHSPRNYNTNDHQFYRGLFKVHIPFDQLEEVTQ